MQAGYKLCPLMKVVTPLSQRKIPAQLVTLAEHFRWIFFLCLCQEQGWGTGWEEGRTGVGSKAGHNSGLLN